MVNVTDDGWQRLLSPAFEMFVSFAHQWSSDLLRTG